MWSRSRPKSAWTDVASVMNARHLFLDLILAAEDVRIVLRESAHAHQAVQRA